MKRGITRFAFLIALSGSVAAGSASSQPAQFGVDFDLASEVGLTSVFSTSNGALETESGYLIAGTRVIEPPRSDAVLIDIEPDGSTATASLLRLGEVGGSLQARGVVHSHDNEHLIVVGSAQINALSGLWMAKIGLESQRIVWSRWLSVDREDVFAQGAFAIRLPGDELGDRDYLVGGRASNWSAPPHTSHQVLARISDDGKLQWANRYDRSSGTTWDEPVMAHAAHDLVYVSGLRDNAYPYVMRIYPATGELDSEAFFYSNPYYRAVDGNPFLAEVGGDFVLAYHVESYGPGSGGGKDVALLHLDQSLDAQNGTLYYGPNRGVAAYFDGNEIHLHTLTGFQPSILRLDPQGTILSHHVLQAAQIDPGKSPPMAPVNNGYLASGLGVKASELYAIRTDQNGHAPCMSDAVFDQTPLDFNQHGDDYVPVPWGEFSEIDVAIERGGEARGRPCR